MTTLRIRPAVAALVALLSLWVAEAAFAWGPVGHMLVADLAYRRMSTAERARAVQILKAAFDPDPAKGLANFEADLTAGLAPGATAEERDRYLFMRAAVWPDVIRERGSATTPAHPLNKEFHKGLWHFLDIPYKPPGDAVVLPPVAKPTTPDVEPKDAVSAIRKCARDLGDAAVSPRVKAARLCFLLHVIGDVHQPMHGVSMYSDDKLATGDRGGNLMLVRKKNPAAAGVSVISLHGLFDEIFGEKTGLADVLALADPIAADPNFAPAKLAAEIAVTDEVKWCEESRALAIKHAYLDGKIDAFRGISSFQFNDNRMKPDLVPLLKPDDYEANALGVCKGRVALAGLRLAEALKPILK